MQHTRNGRLPIQAVRTREAERALARRAHQLAPRIEAGTRKDTGTTAGSTHVETGHVSASGDRPAVWIVQTGFGSRARPGAPVPLAFRHDRNYMLRALVGAG